MGFLASGGNLQEGSACAKFRGAATPRDGLVLAGGPC